MDNMIGRELGRYHILEPLGEGGMASVYKAFDTRLERDVAVKIIRTEMFGSVMMERLLKRFEREAKTLARLSHPNIVKVLDYGEYKGSPYLVLEYLPGGTLKQRLGAPMPWQEAVRLLLPIADALEYTHELNIIHRDIKPSNILLTVKGQPMLTDFGIAKILDLEEGQTLTGTGVGVGTPEYMAPEQWIGKVVAGSDIYSLGVVFYEMVTGHKPYSADTPAALLIKQTNDPLPRPIQFIPDLPEAVEKVILKVLAKKPEDRYQTMGEFAKALEGIASRQPQPVPEPAAAKITAPALPRPEPDLLATIDQISVLQTSGAERLASIPHRPAQTIQRDQGSNIRYWIMALVVMTGLTVLGVLAIWFFSRPAPANPAGSNPIISTTPLPSEFQFSTPTLEPAIPVSKIKVGLVPMIGKINDTSLNSLSWQGVTDAMAKFGLDGSYLGSSQPSDYAMNIQQMLRDRQDLIITVSFLLGVDTAAAAKANPDQKFAIVDGFYPDCWTGAIEGKDCGSFVDLPNVRGLMFQTDQAAFLAGYLAAGMTKTGKVATFGGLQIPTVTIFMKGFQSGVKYYNLNHKTNVLVLGWDDASQKGVFIGNFTSTTDGSSLAATFVQQGADILLPVTGSAALGSAAYCKTSRQCLIFGVDTDWYVTYPDYADVELSSVLKNFELAVFNTIEDVVNGNFSGGTVTYTLADGGVDLAPFHNFENQVPQTLKDELAKVKAAIINGDISVDGILQNP